ncbi:hypothetical protein [Arthrobacter sp. StoSoilB5]|uniref:hypothetical protein n=1 Tax=Arthrobacter sp. StoSoilB5 TaxID=2830992 RepID=UPI0021E10F3A|nr:hypothetical protein [Arthrobacter sp. StoSoilB5]
MIAVGTISSYDDVNSILLAGRADLIALGRTHLYDPQWTLHIAAEHEYQNLGAQRIPQCGAAPDVNAGKRNLWQISDCRHNLVTYWCELNLKEEHIPAFAPHVLKAEWPTGQRMLKHTEGQEPNGFFATRRGKAL